MFKFFIGLFIFCSMTTHAQDWSKVRGLIQKAITQKTLPGGVLLVGDKDKILFHEAFGKKGTALNSTETIYDVASLTKVVATATSIMILEEQGKLSLNDTLQSYYPEFKGSQKESVTIEDILRHKSGLAAGISAVKAESFPVFIRRVLGSPLSYRPGSQTVYSDLGFIILGQLVEKISGKSISHFSSEFIFTPLQMSSTYYHLPEILKKRCAPTITAHLCLPHDPIAFRFSPYEVGHAGVFSTAEDLSHLVQMYLNLGVYGGVRVLREETVKKMTVLPENEQRGLGWDLLSVYSTKPRGDIYPMGISYGHTGYTGTTIWIDPASETYVIFLANRVALGDAATSARFGQLRKDISTEVARLFYP